MDINTFLIILLVSIFYVCIISLAARYLKLICVAIFGCSLSVFTKLLLIPALKLEIQDLEHKRTMLKEKLRALEINQNKKTPKR